MIVLISVPGSCWVRWRSDRAFPCSIPCSKLGWSNTLQWRICRLWIWGGTLGIVPLSRPSQGPDATTYYDPGRAISPRPTPPDLQKCHWVRRHQISIRFTSHFVTHKCLTSKSRIVAAPCLQGPIHIVPSKSETSVMSCGRERWSRSLPTQS